MRELLALAAGLIIAAILGAGYLSLQRQSNVTGADARYAATAGVITSDARTFLNTQHAVILSDISAAGGGAVVFHVADFITAGAADPSASSTTVTGGTWCFMVRAYGTNLLQGLLTPVGETRPLSTIDANIVAANAAQPNAGVISGGGTVASGPDFSQALSAFTGANVCKPGNSAFAAIIADGDVVGVTNFLQRTPCPNNPAACTMATNLNMGGNSLTNALHIVAQDVSTTGQPAANPGDIEAKGNFKGTGLNLTGNEAVAGSSTAGSYTTTGTGTFATLIAPVFDHTSDLRKKTPLEPISDPWDLLRPLDIGAYRYLDSGRPAFGMTAQSVLATMPQLVTTDRNGFLAVDYDSVFAVGLEELRLEHEELVEVRSELDVLRRREEASALSCLDALPAWLSPTLLPMPCSRPSSVGAAP